MADLGSSTVHGNLIVKGEINGVEDVAIGDGTGQAILKLENAALEGNKASRIEFRLNDNQNVQIRHNSHDSQRAPFGLHIERTGDNPQTTSKAYLDVEGNIYSNGTQVSLNGHTHNYAASSHSHAWSAITSKPSTFAPSSHTHNASTITTTTSGAASTVVQTDSAGDITARLMRSTYANQSTISGAMAFRTNNSSDTYIRFCSSPAAIRTWLGVPASSHTHSTYLPKSDVRTGRTTATSTSARSVTFSSAMRTTPVVVASYTKTGANVASDWGCIKVHNLTASGFSIIIGGTASATARNIEWIAITL